MRRPPREDTEPWYKQFWPWFLISLPLSVVIAALFTINLALKTDDGLVSDDYYKEGLAVHKVADSSAKAVALGIAGQLRYDADTGAVNVTFDRPLPNGTATLSLDVTHPTLPHQDQSTQLTPSGETTYAGRLQPLGAAHWKLKLYPADKIWRIEGRLTLPQSSVAQLN